MESIPENTNTEQLTLPLEDQSSETLRTSVLDTAKVAVGALRLSVAERRADRAEHHASVHRKLGELTINGLAGDANPFSDFTPETVREKWVVKKAHKLADKKASKENAALLQSRYIEKNVMTKGEKKDRLKEIKKRVKNGTISSGQAATEKYRLSLLKAGKSKAHKKADKLIAKRDEATDKLANYTFGQANWLTHKASGMRSQDNVEGLPMTAIENPPVATPGSKLALPTDNPDAGEQLVLDFDAETTPQTSNPSETAESKTEDTKFDTVLAEILREEMLKEVETQLNTERQAALKNKKGFDKITRRQEIEKGLVDALVIKFFGKSSQEELEKDIPSEDRQKLRDILSGHTGTDDGTNIETTEQSDPSKIATSEARPTTELEKIGAKLSKRIGKIIASELKVAGKVDPMQRRKITRAAYDRVLSEHYGISTDELYENSPEDLDELFTAIEAAHAAFKKSRQTDSSSKRSGRQTPRSKQPAPRPASKNNRRNNSRKSHRNAGFQDSVLTNDIG